MAEARAAQVQVRLRACRMAAGWSQAALAARVGVSRQALVAIEAGRQVPSTLLSLQLARALGTTVEALFSLDGRAGIEADVPPDAGAEAQRRWSLGRVDGRWVAHPVAGDRAADARSEAAVGGRVRVHPSRDLDALGQQVLIAGCAPLLGVLSGGAGHAGRASARWIGADSTRALDLLQQGFVHVAGLHLATASEPDAHLALLRARFSDAAMAVVHLARFRQGLLLARGNPLGIRSVADLARPGLRVARRAAGAGAQKLLAASCAAHGIDVAALDGHEAGGHVEVAQWVARGFVDVGVAIEPVALAAGLHFVPLADERFDLVLPRARLRHPGVERLLDWMAGRAFLSDAEGLPGYDLSSTGDAA